MARNESPTFVQSGQIALSELENSTLIVAHGGAGPQDPSGEQFLAARKTLVEAIHGARTLRSAPEMTAAVAHSLEASPRFNAGRGASIQADGVTRVSASFMESRNQRFSAVMNVEDLVHPSVLALHLQNARFSVLDSLGAKELKRTLKLPSESLVTPERFKSWLKYKRGALFNSQATGRSGTIGCVAVDTDGELAALTSTGGVGNETPGRVGDSPTIAGNYCTSSVAVSCTGFGEQIIAHALAPRIAIYFESHKDLRRAMTQAFDEALLHEHSFAAIAVAVDRERRTAHWAGASVNAGLLWAASVSE